VSPPHSADHGSRKTDCLSSNTPAMLFALIEFRFRKWELQMVLRRFQGTCPRKQLVSVVAAEIGAGRG
jgi:hypothetical protein